MSRAKRKRSTSQGASLKRAVTAVLYAGLHVKRIEFRSNGSFVVIPSAVRERDDIVVGSPAIARAMGVSSLTIRRMVHDGRLRAFQTGDASSPLKVRQSEIDRAMHPRRTKAVEPRPAKSTPQSAQRGSPE